MSRPRDLPTVLQFTLPLAGFALLLLLAVQPPLPWPDRAGSSVDVRVGPTAYRVPREDLPWLERWLLDTLEEGETGVTATAVDRLDAELTNLFDLAHARVPELADWYYSLAGEYTRLITPLMIKSGVLEPDHLAERTERMLFGERLLSEHLGDVREGVDALLTEQLRSQQQAWISQLDATLQRMANGAPDSSGPALDLTPLAARLSGHDNPEFLVRMGASSSVGLGAAAGPMIWRAASRRAAATGRVAAARTTARAASRAGSAAAGGALACAPTGPAALGCALVAGTGAWLGTDWLLLRIDEHRHRAEFEAAVHAALVATRASLRDELAGHYERASQTRRRVLGAEIEHTFVPAYHMRQRAPAL